MLTLLAVHGCPKPNRHYSAILSPIHRQISPVGPVVTATDTPAEKETGEWQVVSHERPNSKEKARGRRSKGTSASKKANNPQLPPPPRQWNIPVGGLNTVTILNHDGHYEAFDQDGSPMPNDGGGLCLVYSIMQVLLQEAKLEEVLYVLGWDHVPEEGLKMDTNLAKSFLYGIMRCDLVDPCRMGDVLDLIKQPLKWAQNEITDAFWWTKLFEWVGLKLRVYSPQGWLDYSDLNKVTSCNVTAPT